MTPPPIKFVVTLIQRSLSADTATECRASAPKAVGLMTKVQAKAAMPREQWQALKVRAAADPNQRLYRRWKRRGELPVAASCCRGCGECSPHGLCAFYIPDRQHSHQDVHHGRLVTKSAGKDSGSPFPCTSEARPGQLLSAALPAQ